MIILKEDYDLIKDRIKQIKSELRELATEFHEALNQSSETWHDNAPWDAAKSHEAILLVELEELEKILRSSRIHQVTDNSAIGKFHQVEFNDKQIKIFLAGDFTLRNGSLINDHVVVTLSSPIAEKLISLFK